MTSVDAVTGGRAIRGRQAGFFTDLRSIAGARCGWCRATKKR